MNVTSPGSTFISGISQAKKYSGLVCKALKAELRLDVGGVTVPPGSRGLVLPPRCACMEQRPGGLPGEDFARAKQP